MKHSILFFFAITLLFNHSAFSQNDDFSKNQIKFYFNTINEGYQENNSLNNGIILKEISKVGIPSIAYTWQTSEKKWQEVEISVFFENNEDVVIQGNMVSRSFNERVAYFSGRYERNRILLGSDRVDLSIGGSFGAFYLHNSFLPATSSDGFPIYYNGLHTKLSAIPRVLIKFERFALDFNMPFSVMQLNINTFREDNPIIPDVERTSNRLDYELFPSSYFLQVRLGLVVDLN